MKQSDKRLIRKAKRKARRAKVKTEFDAWRGKVREQLLNLDMRLCTVEETFDKRLSTLEETVAELVKPK